MLPKVLKVVHTQAQYGDETALGHFAVRHTNCINVPRVVRRASLGDDPSWSGCKPAIQQPISRNPHPVHAQPDAEPHRRRSFLQKMRNAKFREVGERTRPRRMPASDPSMMQTQEAFQIRLLSLYWRNRTMMECGYKYRGKEGLKYTNPKPTAMHEFRENR